VCPNEKREFSSGWQAAQKTEGRADGLHKRAGQAAEKDSPPACTFPQPSLMCSPLAHPVVQPASVEQIGDFWNLNPVQNFLSVIRSDPNPVDLSKYLIQSGFYLKKKLWLSILLQWSMQFGYPYLIRLSFLKIQSNPVRFWSTESGWIAIRRPDHVQHCSLPAHPSDCAARQLVLNKSEISGILIQSKTFFQ